MYFEKAFHLFPVLPRSLIDKSDIACFVHFVEKKYLVLETNYVLHLCVSFHRIKNFINMWIVSFCVHTSFYDLYSHVKYGLINKMWSADLCLLYWPLNRSKAFELEILHPMLTIELVNNVGNIVLQYWPLNWSIMYEIQCYNIDKVTGQ